MIQCATKENLSSKHTLLSRKYGGISEITNRVVNQIGANSGYKSLGLIDEGSTRRHKKKLSIFNFKILYEKLGLATISLQRCVKTLQINTIRFTKFATVFWTETMLHDSSSG